MDYRQMTAPCGLDCFNCDFFLAKTDATALARITKISEEFNIPLEVMFCEGCRAHDGRIPLQMQQFGEDHRCAAYECAQKKGVAFCGDCGEFPCDNLHPYADMAAMLPHNFKVFNLCLIRRMGLEKWAQTKAAKVRQTYFTTPWHLD